ncbi:hypothetical protein K438DRAFT_2153188 [Mycena galopus ATCC 62051]|nr:hypothetical protein K438DRAFT_2153188 [Mycena galopus ATCC 62051]
MPPSDATAPATPEVLLTSSEASSMLRTLSSSKIEALARKNTTLGTSDGAITDESFASILSRCTVVFSSNKTWSLHLEVRPSDVRPLEYVVLVYPRSSWAFNVGPGGNYGQVSWKANDKCPKGIDVQWSKHFLNPRTAEYAVSGRPISWDAVRIHELLDAKWASFAQGRDDLDKKKSSNGPSTSMFLSARRPVFTPNSATQDEGRASEYNDSYKLLSLLGDNTDLRFNRIPEVLIYNAADATYHPMSFHQLHRLGEGLVMLLTMTPMAFSWGGRQHGNVKDLSWEYRLLTITVIGRREADALASPSKMILKCKAVHLDLDDSDDKRAKKPAGTGKTAAAGRPGAGSSTVSTTGPGPSTVSTTARPSTAGAGFSTGGGASGGSAATGGVAARPSTAGAGGSAATGTGGGVRGAIWCTWFCGFLGTPWQASRETA